MTRQAYLGMNTCRQTRHEEVAFIGHRCPACLLADVLDSEVQELQEAYNIVKEERDNLRERLNGLENDLRESIRLTRRIAEQEGYPAIE